MTAKSEKKAGLGAIFLILFLDILGFSLVLPFLAQEARDVFGASPFVGTLLGSVYSLMQFIFVPVWGRISDRIGRRPVLLWSVFAAALAMGGLGLALVYATSVLWFFVPRILSGIATANIGTASAYIADVTKPEDRARGMATIGIAFGAGFTVGPAVGGALSDIAIHGRHGAVPCFVAAALSLVNFGWAYFGLKESLPLDRRAEGGRRIVPLDFAAAGQAFHRPGILNAVIVNFFIVLSFTVLDQVFRYFTMDIFAWTPLQTGWFFVFVGIVAALVQGGVVRPLAKRMDESKLVLVGSAAQALAFVVVALSASRGTGVLYAGGALLAIGNGLSQPAIAAYISKRADPRAQGATLGTNQSFSALARMCGPALGGFLYGSFSPLAPFTTSAAGMGLACVLAWFLTKVPPAETAPAAPAQ